LAKSDDCRELTDFCDCLFHSEFIADFICMYFLSAYLGLLSLTSHNAFQEFILPINHIITGPTFFAFTAGSSMCINAINLILVGLILTLNFWSAESPILILVLNSCA